MNTIRHTPRAWFQFSIVELLLFVVMAFIGMYVIEFVFHRSLYIEIGFGMVVLSTAFGALIGLSFVGADRAASWRYVLSGILLGWAASIWLALIVAVCMERAFLAAIVIVLMGMPPATPIFLLIVRAFQRRPSCKAAATRLMLAFLVLHCGSVFALSPYLLRTRGCGGQTAAMAACLSFAESEEIYHRTDYSKRGIQYAPSLQTLLGKHGELALVDKTFAHAEYGCVGAEPKYAYYFKVLLAQGPNAAGGAKSYLDSNGNMTRGYALIAFPADYPTDHADGYHDSFIINQTGTIYQRDLGPNSASIASTMTEFDPDTNWVPTQ